MSDDMNGTFSDQAKRYPRICTQCGETAVMPATVAYDAEAKHDG